MNLQENIERIHEIMGGVINEQSESKKDALKSMLKQSGFAITSKLMGGIDNIIKVLYDGDIMKFSEDTHTPLAYMGADKMSLYLHEALVEELGLNDNLRPQHRVKSSEDGSSPGNELQDLETEAQVRKGNRGRTDASPAGRR